MERIVKRFREHAGRNASERRTSLERRNARADPLERWGRPKTSLWRNEANDGLAGVGATACVQDGDVTKHGKPQAAMVRPSTDSRERQAGLSGVAERLVVPWKPGNAGGGKGPQFKADVDSGGQPGDGRRAWVRSARPTTSRIGTSVNGCDGGCVGSTARRAREYAGSRTATCSRNWA